jgi:hypothetical protein
MDGNGSLNGSHPFCPYWVGMERDQAKSNRNRDIRNRRQFINYPGNIIEDKKPNHPKKRRGKEFFARMI